MSTKTQGENVQSARDSDSETFLLTQRVIHALSTHANASMAWPYGWWMVKVTDESQAASHDLGDAPVDAP